MKPILVIRFSSLGDVALVVPVFKSLESQLPQQRFLMVSEAHHADLFKTCSNVEFIDAKLRGSGNGFGGLFRLVNKLNAYDFQAVVDLHDVFRSQFVRTAFQIKGKRVHTYQKLRSRKNQMIKNRLLDQAMPHTAKQYLNAFKFLDPNLKLIPGPWIHPHKKVDNVDLHIGVAPFSQHTAKEWPHEHMIALIDMLQKQAGATVHCMAFTLRETAISLEWKKQLAGLRIIDGSYSIQKQLEFIASMDILVSMDSANLHMASLVGTPVISIWGPTHPNLGFGPLISVEGIVQPSEQDWPQRPLSRYGVLENNRAYQVSAQAMASIVPELVYSKITKTLQSKRKITSG